MATDTKLTTYANALNGTQSPSATNGTNAVTPADPRILDARKLRQLAEKASGLRYKDLVLVFREADGDAPAGWDLVDPAVAATLPEPKIRVNGKSQAPTAAGWGTMKKVHVEYGTIKNDLEEDCDAVFWSQPAMEKFVLGYYLPLLETKAWRALHARVLGELPNAPTLYGIAHTYPSIERELADGVSTFLTKEGPLSESAFIAESLDFFLAKNGNPAIAPSE